MRSIIMLILVALSCSPAHAQVNMGTLSFQMSLPQGGYKKTYPVTGTGLMFDLVHTFKAGSRWSAGAEFGILQVSGDDNQYTGYYNNEFNTYVVASWNHIITLAPILLYRLTPTQNRIQVYAQGTVGTNMFLTTSSISRDLPDYYPVEFRTKYYYSDNHVSFSLRTGAGLLGTAAIGKHKTTSIVLKGSWLWGSSVKYYAHPFVQNQEIIIYPRQSTTAMFLAQAGIRFGTFNGSHKL
ncbi:MAG: hypothetical protein QM802_12085 [Agriterribacter sp.]